MKFALIITLATLAVSSVSARPMRRVYRRQNDAASGAEAIRLNESFRNIVAGAECSPNGPICAGDAFAQCDNGRVAVLGCAGGTVCRAVPLVNVAGTDISCLTQADFDARIAATGADAAAPPPPAEEAAAEEPPAEENNNDNNNDNNNNDNAGGNVDPNLVLDASIIGSNFALTGQEGTPAAGQVESLTSTNNFINFCVGQTVTNGEQNVDGSCNPVPMGQIPSKANMPSSKFIFPTNGVVLQQFVPFTITMNVARWELGNFVNAQSNYYAAPQQLNANGQIKGHSHVTIDRVNALDDTTPTNPETFEFFQGVNGAAVDGVVTAEAVEGIKNAGIFRMCSINAAANHQPVLAPIAQHGSLDDCVYFEVTANPDGAPADDGAAARRRDVRSNRRNFRFSR